MPNTSAAASGISVEIKQIIAAQKVVIFPQSSLTVDRERVTILHSTGSDESTPCISELGPGEGLDFNLGRRVQNPMLGRRTPTGQSEAERTRKRPTQTPERPIYFPEPFSPISSVARANALLPPPPPPLQTPVLCSISPSLAPPPLPYLRSLIPFFYALPPSHY